MPVVQVYGSFVAGVSFRSHIIAFRCFLARFVAFIERRFLEFCLHHVITRPPVSFTGRRLGAIPEVVALSDVSFSVLATVARCQQK